MNAKFSKKMQKILILGIVCGAVLGTVITYAAASRTVDQKKTVMAETEKKWQAENKKLKSQIETQSEGEKSVESAAVLSEKQPDDWALVLVNDSYPLDTKYVPELTEIASGYSVDTRIAEDTNKMLADAKAVGFNVHITSAYRSYNDQTAVFNDTMQDWVNQGNSYLDAYNETKKSVAVPGYSEHALGLALDITSVDYQGLDEKQADTPETKWLMKNCYKYGFILRYPSEEIETTGITYEPWHYRYVGKDAAKEITEKGITLEEYLGVK
ncbi:M15 family metallopeptidase [Clostridium sp. C105KSO13]|uniref:M15 family metallopeptidase n=1 Tax=Clostridium sp. C105KSO13 TaxID=1776045 RepID=UPI0007406913|nr:M15 family metallopeptidase [Clostridium sp. C105KSO13]CUX32160.1 D-alanyl-D-alanine carboxypeptidase [Clostridium sp. C105KSO13]